MSLPEKSLILDVGAGNGKYLLFEDSHMKVGLDMSFELCKICRQKNLNIFQADCLSLPVADCRFDAAISVAVIHHFSTEDRRQRALRELVRVVKPGGQVLVYVWAFEQLKCNRPSVYLQTILAKKRIQPCVDQCDASPIVQPASRDRRQLPALPVFDKTESFRDQDFLLPWKVVGSCNDCMDHTPKSALRFYHVYVEKELESACALLAGCAVRHSFYEQGNWAVILQKKFLNSQ